MYHIFIITVCSQIWLGTAAVDSTFCYLLLSQLSAAKVQPTTHEQSVIVALNTAAGSELSQQQKRKRKRAKAPNPLSVKKSHKMSGGSTSVSSGVASRSTKVHCMHAQFAPGLDFYKCDSFLVPAVTEATIANKEEEL